MQKEANTYPIPMTVWFISGARSNSLSVCSFSPKHSNDSPDEEAISFVVYFFYCIINRVLYKFLFCRKEIKNKKWGKILKLTFKSVRLSLIKSNYDSRLVGTGGLLCIIRWVMGIWDYTNKGYDQSIIISFCVQVKMWFWIMSLLLKTR